VRFEFFAGADRGPKKHASESGRTRDVGRHGRQAVRKQRRVAHYRGKASERACQTGQDPCDREQEEIHHVPLSGETVDTLLVTETELLPAEPLRRSIVCGSPGAVGSHTTKPLPDVSDAVSPSRQFVVGHEEPRGRLVLTQPLGVPVKIRSPG
jgi:hypothetical protein